MRKAALLLVSICGACGEPGLSVVGGDQQQVEAIVRIVGQTIEQDLLSDLAGATIIIASGDGNRANPGTMTAYVEWKPCLAHSALIHEILHLAVYTYGWQPAHTEPGVWATDVDDFSYEARSYRQAWHDICY